MIVLSGTLPTAMRNAGRSPATFGSSTGGGDACLVGQVTWMSSDAPAAGTAKSMINQRFMPPGYHATG